jgi:hypothetical protein
MDEATGEAEGSGLRVAFGGCIQPVVATSWTPTREREGRMQRRKWRGGLSQADQEELWQRWRRSESLSAIARTLDRRRKVVQRILAGTGGVAPVARRRSARVLSLAEREEISRGVAVGHSMRQIADQTGGGASASRRGAPRSGATAPRATRADARPTREAPLSGAAPQAVFLRRTPQ